MRVLMLSRLRETKSDYSNSLRGDLAEAAQVTPYTLSTCIRELEIMIWNDGQKKKLKK